MKHTAAVITISDKASRREREDTSGPALMELMKQYGLDTAYYTIVPDESADIRRELVHCADSLRVSLVLTTGGTGFSPRDITPEATRLVIEREVPGIPEAMRAASMTITPRGCLSRSIAGIRGRTLIVNLPGSKKAATENILSVMDGLLHGLDMLASGGSADCAEKPAAISRPSLDGWLKEAKADPSAPQCGMYLAHNGVVRVTPRAAVRNGQDTNLQVCAIHFSYDAERVAQAEERVRAMPGIYYTRVWLNQGVLEVGDDLMFVLVGGDIRPRVISGLESLVNEIKTSCVREQELYANPAGADQG